MYMYMYMQNDQYITPATYFHICIFIYVKHALIVLGTKPPSYSHVREREVSFFFIYIYIYLKIIYPHKLMVL